MVPETHTGCRTLTLGQAHRSRCTDVFRSQRILSMFRPWNKAFRALKVEQIQMLVELATLRLALALAALEAGSQWQLIIIMQHTQAGSPCHDFGQSLPHRARAQLSQRTVHMWCTDSASDFGCAPSKVFTFIRVFASIASCIILPCMKAMHRLWQRHLTVTYFYF